MKKILFPVLLTTLLIGCRQAPAPSDPGGDQPLPPASIETREDFYNFASELGTYQYLNLSTTFSMRFFEDEIEDTSSAYTSESRFAYEDGSWVLKEGVDTPYDFTNDYTALAYLLYYEGDDSSDYEEERWTYGNNPLNFTYFNKYIDDDDGSITDSTFALKFNEKGYLVEESITYFTTHTDETTYKSLYVYTYLWG